MIPEIDSLRDRYIELEDERTAIVDGLSDVPAIERDAMYDAIKAEQAKLRKQMGEARFRELMLEID